MPSLRVPLPKRELEVLQKYPPKRGNGVSVDIDIQTDVQDEVLFQNLFDGEKVLVRAGNQRQGVRHESDQMVD